MTTKHTNLLFALLVLVSFGMAAWAYPQLPPLIAGHWNAAGQVDGYMSKGWALFLLPSFAALLWGLFNLLPTIDPKRANLSLFEREYNLLFLLLALVFVTINKLTLLWNLGLRFPITNLIGALVGILALGLGGLLPKVRQNYFLGIRTPWTLASEPVWTLTHQRAGRRFLAAGAVALVGAFLPQGIGLWLAAGALIVAALWSVAESYVLYRDERRQAH